MREEVSYDYSMAMILTIDTIEVKETREEKKIEAEEPSGGFW